MSFWLSGPPSRPKRAQGPQNVCFDRFPDEILGPFGGRLGHIFDIFFPRVSGTLKKGVQEGHSKVDLFFGRFWGLPGGPQEGSRVHGSSIFTFAAGPKKVSKMGAKMEPFGLPNPNYTHFGAPFVRNWCPKSCIEKRLQNNGQPHFAGSRLVNQLQRVTVISGPTGGGQQEGENTKQPYHTPTDPRGVGGYIYIYIQCLRPTPATALSRVIQH